MKSAMVLWINRPDQYQTQTPLAEIAEHAERHGFNDRDVEVLCLHGAEHIPARDVEALAKRRFHLRPVEPIFGPIRDRFPNLRAAYRNHFFECFLRWHVLREYFQGEPILAWDADIFFNARLSEVEAAFEGSTLTASSTCFASISDPNWLEEYTRSLEHFESDPVAGREAIRTRLAALGEQNPSALHGSHFSSRIREAIINPQAWSELFDSTPEELFVDQLTRAGRLPYAPAPRAEAYWLCTQPLLLPLLAWTHPFGAGIGSPEKVERLTFRNGQYRYGSRPLAFLHFQGAVQRACSAHMILNRFLKHPAPLYDPWYCKPEQRKGRSVPDVIWGEANDQLPLLKDRAALFARWGDPRSERNVARHYLMESNLTEVFESLCSDSDPPVETDLKGKAWVPWRDLVEEANGLLAKGDRIGAAGKLVAAVKTVETCENPLLTLEALLDIGARLTVLDPRRANILLPMAERLGLALGKPEAVARVKELTRTGATGAAKTEGLNVQTAEIAARFASQERHRPTFAEVRNTLHGNGAEDAFQFPAGMSPVGYNGALAHPEDACWMLDAAVSGRTGPIFGLEVGTFVGSTAVKLGKAMKAREGSHLLCIDPFTGSGEMWFVDRFRKDLQFKNGRPRIFELWMENIRRNGLAECIQPWCLTSMAAAQMLGFLPWIVDFVFLDSAHLQDETHLEIKAYWRLLEKGGLLFGDDYDSFPPVRQDVDRFVAETGLALMRSPSGRLWALRK